MSKASYRILVAEDNEINLKVIKAILDKGGFCYEIAVSGQDTIDLFSRGKFNLVLMDCQMPGIDGLAATRVIRQTEELEERERCPIIALTASVMSGDREQCLNAGMDDFISKPYRARQLIDIINTYIEKKASA